MGGAAHTVYLSKTNYLQLTEIYAIEVLAKLQKNYVAAHLWIQNASISDGEKQVIPTSNFLFSQWRLAQTLLLFFRLTFSLLHAQTCIY